MNETFGHSDIVDIEDELQDYIASNQHKITTEICASTKKFLGKSGVGFFTEMVNTHGKVSPVFMKGGIPHCVHFREGMQVRNHLRTTGLCDDWSQDDYDNLWAVVVERVLEDVKENTQGQ